MLSRSKREATGKPIGFTENSFWIGMGISSERKNASLERFLSDAIPAFKG